VVEEPVEEEPIPVPSRTRSTATNVTSMSKDETVLAQEQEENKRALTTQEEEDEVPQQTEEKDDTDNLKVERVDTLHADITLPLHAKSGDFLDVEHDKDIKTIKVPQGTKGGDEFTVRFTKKDDEEAPQPRMCGCL